MKRTIKILLLVVLSIITTFLFVNNVYGATITNLSASGVTWNGTKVGYFEIDGRQAFCIDHSKTTPHTRCGIWE